MHIVTAPERRFDGSSCQEQRVCDAQWQARCHEGQCEEYQVNACHVHYSLVFCTGCLGRSGCNDDLPLVIGGGSVGRTVASEALDAMFLDLLFVFLVESQVAHDAALVPRIN